MNQETQPSSPEHPAAAKPTSVGKKGTSGRKTGRGNPQRSSAKSKKGQVRGWLPTTTEGMLKLITSIVTGIVAIVVAYFQFYLPHEEKVVALRLTQTAEAKMTASVTVTATQTPSIITLTPTVLTPAPTPAFSPTPSLTPSSTSTQSPTPTATLTPIASLVSTRRPTVRPSSSCIQRIGTGPLTAVWNFTGNCKARLVTDGSAPRWVWQADFYIEVRGGNDCYSISATNCDWDAQIGKFICHLEAQEGYSVVQQMTVTCPHCTPVTVPINKSAGRVGNTCVLGP